MDHQQANGYGRGIRDSVLLETITGWRTHYITIIQQNIEAGISIALWLSYAGGNWWSLAIWKLDPQILRYDNPTKPLIQWQCGGNAYVCFYGTYLSCHKKMLTLPRDIWFVLTPFIGQHTIAQGRAARGGAPCSTSCVEWSDRSPCRTVTIRRTLTREGPRRGKRA